MRSALRTAILRVHEDPELHAALATANVERFVPVEDDHYDRIRTIAATDPVGTPASAF